MHTLKPFVCLCCGTENAPGYVQKPSPTVTQPMSRGGPACSPKRCGHFFMPRTSAGERSSRSDRLPDASTFVGPPLAYTPVYVLCTRAPALSARARWYRKALAG